MKNISILGSTGSVGTQALEIIKSHPDKFKVIGLSANRNVSFLLDQIKQFEPEIVALMDEKAAKELKRQLKFLSSKIKKPRVLAGISGLNEIVKEPKSDLILTAIVGAVGIIPTVEAIKAKKTIALANKETLVAAGEIVMKLAKKNKVKIIPVDSEHSAIFQCLMGEEADNLAKIILTCSGGPFRSYQLKDFKQITLKKALKHPSWNMGGKITIDSSTLMNKGLEVIEAHHLFQTPYAKIKVLIHPQSYFHSLVEFKDHSIKAQIGYPTMLVPIQLAFSYPKRLKTKIIPKLDLLKLNEMQFEKPDFKKFPCLNLAYQAGKQGGLMPAVLNAANEAAVSLFLQEKIHYLDIYKIISKTLENHKNVKNPSLEEILAVQEEVVRRVNPNP
jgi:1-deoxy-D-xylulose-5-phosphate reductoisomerase